MRLLPQSLFAKTFWLAFVTRDARRLYHAFAKLGATSSYSYDVLGWHGTAFAGAFGGCY